jgi:hypothetical protein
MTPRPNYFNGTMVRYQSEEIVNARFAAGLVAGALAFQVRPVLGSLAGFFFGPRRWREAHDQIGTTDQFCQLFKKVFQANSSASASLCAGRQVRSRRHLNRAPLAVGEFDAVGNSVSESFTTDIG